MCEVLKMPLTKNKMKKKDFRFMYSFIKTYYHYKCHLRITKVSCTVSILKSVMKNSGHTGIPVGKHVPSDCFVTIN